MGHLKITVKEAQGLHMGKRKEEPFNGLVYVIVIDLSLFLLLTQCCTVKHIYLEIIEKDYLKHVALSGLFC